jgi:hypothetical protein
MALSDTSKTLISIKKLVGKSHTSNSKDVANEALPTGITLSSNTIFAQTVPSHTGSTTHYEILSNSLGEGTVEFLRLSASFIAGADTGTGRHGFELKLPDDYVSHSGNPSAGTYPFLNSQSINITSGSLQLVPPSFDSDYEALPYHTGSGQVQIPVLDARDWSLDYFNGVFFQQDPPGSGDHSENPRYVDAYLYIGKNADKGIFSSGLSGSLTKLTTGVSYLQAGENVAIQTSSNGQVSISSTNYFKSTSVGNITATGSLSLAGALGDSHIAGSIGTDTFFFISGSANSRDTDAKGASVFGGDLLTSGSLISLGIAGGAISGSITRTSQGLSYIAGSTDILVSSSSSGQISISSTSQQQRKKYVYEVTASHGQLSDLPVTGFDIANVNSNPDRVDIFVNGQLMTSGTSKDYLVAPVGSSIRFYFDLFAGDIVAIRTY